LALKTAGLKEYILGRDFASAQGIHGSLSAHFSGLFLVDEIGHVLQGVMNPRSPQYLRQIATALIELSTSAVGLFMDAAKGANRDPEVVRFDIPDPCLCLYATTTPQTLWDAMTSSRALDGFLARFILFETPQNYPDPKFDIEPLEDRLEDISGMLQRLVVGPGNEPTAIALGQARASMEPVWIDQGNGRRSREAYTPKVPRVPMSSVAQGIDRNITIEEVRLKRENEGKSLATAVIARTTEHVRRLALIRAVSRNPKYPEVDGEDMVWAHAVVQLSHDLMIPAVETKISDTETEANSRKLWEVIHKAGGWIDGSQLTQRTRYLSRRDRTALLEDLLEAEQIEMRIEPTASKPRRFYRAIKRKQ
jgi:hypothetical protein